MNYDVKDSENPVYEHLFPFYRDFCIKKIGYKLKKNTVYKPSKVIIVDLSSKL